MLIGIEIELHSNSRDIYNIANAEGLNFETFTYKDGLNIKMSVEYYPKTIEYNFEPKTLTKAYLEKVSKFMKKQIKKHSLEIAHRAPSFVGTHIHIFDLKFRKLKGQEILETSMHYIDKEFSKLRVESKRRLALSHQLWGNYVYNYFDDYHRVCLDNGVSMSYTGMGAGRPKYNPYIVSDRSNKGKPRSVEIRIIPNEFLFNNKLYELLTAIQKGNFKRLDINDTLQDWVEGVARR